MVYFPRLAQNNCLPATARADSLPAASMALVDLGKELRRVNYRFVTPTPTTIALVNARPGNERARSLADVFGWNREFNPLLIPAAILGAMRDAGVLEETANGLRSCRAKR
jgi:hypothetical protein